MKIDFIIISSILVIICFLPFILFPLLANKEEKSLKKRFNEEALKLGLNISYELCWNTNIAGLDILKRQFLLVQKPDMDFEIETVDLNKVRDIQLLTQTVRIKQRHELVEILSRIELEIYTDNLAPKVLTLFDHDLNYNQDFELKNAQILLAELKKYLSAQPVLKRTA